MRWHNFMHVRSLTNIFLVLSILAAGGFLFAASSVSAQEEGETAAEVVTTGGTESSPTEQAATTGTGQLSREGIFDCSAARYQNIGTLTAIGGVYVPVNDAAVTLNTGYLVYKECVLDGVVSRTKESATAELARQNIVGASTGRGGQAQWLEDPKGEYTRRMLLIYQANLQDSELAPACAAFRNVARTAIVRSIQRSINEPSRAYKCPFTESEEEQQRYFNNEGFTYGKWFASVRPEGNLIGATALIEARSAIDTQVDNTNFRDLVLQGNGFIPQFNQDTNPLTQKVVTPGYILAESLSQVVGSGYRQLESANEIDQIVSALWGGLTTQLLTDTRGLVGLTRPQNGQQSYLDRMAAEASLALRNSAINTALSILSTARQIEAQYRQAKETLANNLTNAILTLRDTEAQCWELIIPKVQEYAQSQGGASLTIATSTQFSQPIIDGSIAPLATTTIRDLNASEAALALINQLIASVTNSSSLTNQRAALERLDVMVANNQLHSAQDAQNAIKLKDDASAAINTLINDTRTAWADSTDPNIGWCNINNQSVIERWYNEWRT